MKRKNLVNFVLGGILTMAIVAGLYCNKSRYEPQTSFSDKYKSGENIHYKTKK